MVNLSKPHRQFLIILCIIVAGSIFATVSATTISGDIITNNLTVTGTCTGCGVGGASEGSYSHYNTIDLNTTLSLGFVNSQTTDVHISNDGNIIYSGNVLNVSMLHNGTWTLANFSYTNISDKQQGQSLTGKYQVILDDTTNLNVDVLKDGLYLQALGINLSQFTTPSTNGAIGIAISPDGKYIAVVGEDSGGVDQRILIFRGT